MDTGRSLNGHAPWHLPHLMQPVSSGISACGPSKARMALLFLMIGKCIRVHSTSHHRSAHEDLLRLSLVSSTCCDNICDPCTDRNDDILRLCNGIAVYRHSLRCERSSWFPDTEPINAIVVTLERITPTSAGSIPALSVLPVIS